MRVTNLLDEPEKRNMIDPAVYKALENRKNAEADAYGKDNSKNDNSGVSLEISDEAMQKYIDLLNFQQDMEAARQQGEAAKDSGEELGKILTIFRRILNGDRVPPKDEKKLMEYSSEMYQAAKAVAAMSKNKKPKDYKSVDKDDEPNENKKYEPTGIIGMYENGAEASAKSASTELPE